MLRVGALVVAALSIGVAPNGWDADSLVPSLREADRVLAKSHLPAQAFAHAPVRNERETQAQFDKRFLDWRTESARYRECVGTLHSLKLFTLNQWVTLIPTKAIMHTDGSIHLDGRFVASSRTRLRSSFTTAGEQIAIQDEELARQRLTDVYDDKLRRCRRSYSGQYSGRQRQQCLDDATREYKPKLQGFDTDSGRKLQPVYAAIQARKDAYTTVSFVAIGGSELAARIDLTKLAKARMAKIMFKVTDVVLSAPIANAGVPAVPYLISCELLDVEKRYYLKTP